MFPARINMEGSNLAATEMGLIYVNPEGPQASGDPKSAAPFISPQFTSLSGSQTSSRPAPKPKVRKPEDSSAMFPARIMQA
jgi:hypothetical protein